MPRDLLAHQTSLQQEAHSILHQRGVLATIARYGEAEVTGSVLLGTMYKRDIDISLCNEGLDYAAFFRLGGELAALLQPHGVFGRNTQRKAVANRPAEAFYWGMEFDDWKLDLWAVTRDHFLESREYCAAIQARLDAENRLLVLQIKAAASRAYNRAYSSKEVYQAVFYDGVRSVAAFEEWLQARIGWGM